MKVEGEVILRVSYQELEWFVAALQAADSSGALSMQEAAFVERLLVGLGCVGEDDEDESDEEETLLH